VSTAPPTRGRPRSSEADAAIVRATLELLVAEGYRALSVERVARAAGVGKATIYRRHRTKPELVAAAVRHLHADLAVPEDTGSFAGDFAAVAAQLEASGSRTGAYSLMPRMLAEAAGDPELHEIFTTYLVSPRRRVLAVLIDRAKDRGEIRPDVDPEVAIDLIAGPMIYRLLIGGLEFDELRERAIAIMVLAIEGLRPR
jgi:AcrR family transcriptional regulator